MRREDAKDVKNIFLGLRVLRTFAAVLLCGCGGRAAPVRQAGDEVEVALYRDAAYVTERRRAPLAAGRNEVVFGRVARTVVPGSARLSVVGGAAAEVIEARHALAAPDGDEVLRGWIGRDVNVGGLRGRLRSVGADQLV